MKKNRSFWDRLKRKRRIRKERKSFLIVCEGEKTEPNYFKAFRVASLEVKILGSGHVTKSLVNYTKKQVKLARNLGEYHDQVWCVFDKDSFTKEQFNTAVQQAESLGYKVAYSNECFELWYILHYEYLTSGLNRKQYFKKLGKLLGRKYEKKNREMYSKLSNNQERAIRNATKLLKRYNPIKPADDNPSTTVHLLVQELNKYSK